MISMFWVALALYTIIGVGYSKTLNRLMKDSDFAISLMMVALWPIFLVIAAFWNFKND